MIKVFYIFILILFIIADISYSGPLGTDMGDTKEKFNNLTSTNVNKPGIEVFTTNKMPKNHSLFDTYILYFGNSGLYKIICASKNFENDRYGHDVLVSYNDIKKQLTEKYGNPEVLEFINQGSIWNKQSDFVMSLKQNERRHGCRWTENLPDNLKQISLTILGNSIDSSRIVLGYTYKNIDEVENNINNLEKDSL